MFVCPVCGERFDDDHAAAEHWFLEHARWSENGVFMLCICSEDYSNMNDFGVHVRGHGGFLRHYHDVVLGVRNG